VNVDKVKRLRTVFGFENCETVPSQNQSQELTYARLIVYDYTKLSSGHLFANV
jgi:hypothetical protein